MSYHYKRRAFSDVFQRFGTEITENQGESLSTETQGYRHFISLLGAIDSCSNE